jgi:exopolysaccharide biosynthesis polyprenyl glycosylphosphotransferase
MQIHQLMDACLFAVCFWLAYEARTNTWITTFFRLDPVRNHFDDFVWMYLLLIPAAPLVLEAQGFYARPILGSRRVTAWMLLKACAIMVLGLIITLFLLRIYLPRNVPIWFGVASFIMVFAKEELLRFAMMSDVAKAQWKRRFILVGEDQETALIEAEFKVRREQEVQVVARLDIGKTTTQQLIELLHDHAVNGVIISGRHSYFEQVENVIRVCETEGVEAWLVADFFRTQISRTTLDIFYGRPILVFRTTPEASWQGVMKQLLDLVLSFVLLLVLFVPLLVIALLVKVTSPGPVLFRQQRSGLNGRPFTLYKFRTMVTNAEQLRHELESMNEMNGPVFKVTNDPRITPIGRILRKFSIDEFPQLYNVLRGEMSLVGPRPLPVDEVRRFNDLAHRRRLSVKPGLTCLWQISGRNEVKDFRDWVRLDLEYIDNWSLWLDMKILARTVPVVLAGTGAK